MLRQARELRENLEARETAHTREVFDRLYEHYKSLPPDELKQAYDEIVGPTREPPAEWVAMSPAELIRMYKESL
jgi:hypothetical protein